MSQTTTMRYYNCWVCGIPFAAPQALHEAIKRDAKTLYCPSGCKLGLGESEASKLRKQLVAKQAEVDRECAATNHQRRRAEGLERSNAAVRGHLTRTKNRIAAGVCPCCNRTFKQLARHMKAKHPNYTEATP